MRELKFRVWSDESEMHYPEKNLELCFSVVGAEVMNAWSQGGEHLYEVHIKQIMQYTGMKDKNGEEIYEGDILRGITDNEFSIEKSKKYEVIWGVDHWHIKGTSFFLQELFNYCNNNVFIIGNIYENSTLLTEE
jgi:uncharacterized phage protein (TIGR01671 family)